jgi:hypothetical protein
VDEKSKALFHECSQGASEQGKIGRKLVNVPARATSRPATARKYNEKSFAAMPAMQRTNERKLGLE